MSRMLVRPFARRPGSLTVCVTVVVATAWILVTRGRFGFNPTDDGFVLGQSARLLAGEVPHADIVSPRPLGSAYLHIVDWLLPTPPLLTSRALMALEVMSTVVLFATMFFGAPFWSWPVRNFLLVAAATLISLHSFPLMALHTIDGLFLSTAGLATLSAMPLSRRRLAIGMLLIGVAVLVKQSFLPATLLGTFISVRHWPGRWWNAVLQSAAWVAVPSVLYALHVALGGGIREAFEQLAGAQRAWGDRLLKYPVEAGVSEAAVVLLAVFLICVMLLETGRHHSRGASEFPSQFVLKFAASVGAVVIVVVTALHEELMLMGFWSFQLFYLTIAFLFVRLFVAREIDEIGLLVVLLAYMTSLSWGYDAPNLAAGLMIAYLVGGVLLSGFHKAPNSALVRILPTSMLTAVLVVTGAVWLDGRQSLYRDQPLHLLTADLGVVDRDLRGVRSTPKVAAYIREVKRCANGAEKVGLLPDNPGLYSLLELDNAFSADWFYPPEIASAKDMLLSEANSLRSQHNWVLLLQTQPATELATSAPLPTATSDSAVFDYDGTAHEVRYLVGGRVSSCGPFVKISPGS